jgi:hypothetical protein
MKYNKLSCCILSLLLNTAAVLLFCSCNKNPMLAMVSEGSDVRKRDNAGSGAFLGGSLCWGSVLTTGAAIVAGTTALKTTRSSSSSNQSYLIPAAAVAVAAVAGRTTWLARGREKQEHLQTTAELAKATEAAREKDAVIEGQLQTIAGEKKVARDKDAVIEGQLRTIENLNHTISENLKEIEVYERPSQREAQDLVEEGSRSNKSKVSRRTRK